MNNLKDKLMKVGIVAMIGIMPLVSFAALPTYNSEGLVTTPETVMSIISRVSGYIFWLLMALSIVMVIYAAFLYVTAAGDSEKVGKANQTLTYAVIGIAIALLASGVPKFVENFFFSST